MPCNEKSFEYIVLKYSNNLIHIRNEYDIYVKTILTFSINFLYKTS